MIPELAQNESPGDGHDLLGIGAAAVVFATSLINLLSGKVGCALKVATGSAAAFLCAMTAVHDAALRVTDGICAETPEACIRNMARIGIRGMAQTDSEILAIMTEKI